MKQSIQFLCSLFGLGTIAAAASPDILFIAIDDLRPELGCYGRPVISPNIDRIAAQGMVFERAYCQQSVCGPSRLSIMTGAYPDSLGVYGMGTRCEWRESRSEFTSIPEQFRKNGWYAVGFGKIYDNRLGVDEGFSWDEMTQGWKTHFASPEKRKVEQEWRSASKGQKPDARMAATECADVADDFYTDGHVTKLAVNFLKQYKKDQPLFLAVGFPKPHLPFVAPEKYWKLYNRDSIQLPDLKAAPERATEFTLSDYKEIFDYDVPNPVPDDVARELIHGYYACISYVDAQIGLILDALRECRDLDNTLIVLWGDHGYKLAEYGEWAKHTDLEIDTRVPLIIRLPAGAVQKNGTTKSLAEFVDVLPTMCEAVGIPVPDSAEGRSLLPVLKNPQATVRDFALSQYPHRGCMGYSIRTDGWRYTEWRGTGKTGTVKASELYDLRDAPYETKNVLADEAEKAAEMSALLNEYLRGAKKWNGSIIW